MDAEGLQKFFQPFATVTVRGMFGGRGIYAQGLMFALQAADKLYLKTDDVNAPRFAAAGSNPFIFPTPMGPKETSYWLMPASAHVDLSEFKIWCSLALEAARRAAAAKEAKGSAKSAKSRKNDAKNAKSAKPESRPKAAPAKRGAIRKSTAKKSTRSGKSRAR
ncbi:MAG TPA: TfoX/Sxy family protein [Roseiarcus sp.]|jgi:DNA transformation protein|nr:TfoX/Sxy family protein [Roseiarcus sp.]